MSLEGKFIIPLKDLEEHLVDYEYHLDEEFFKSIDQEEIISGDLDAFVSVKKTVDATMTPVDGNNIEIISVVG